MTQNSLCILLKSYFCVSMHFFILEPQFATPIKFLRCHMTCCVYHITHQCIITTRQSDCNLVGQIMILFLLLSLQCIPPFPKDLANWSVVLVRMSLVHKSTMTFTEYHKCVHWSPHMVTQTIFHLEPTNSRSHCQWTTLINDTSSVVLKNWKWFSVGSTYGSGIFLDMKVFCMTL